MQINYSKFRFSACVDWIDIQVRSQLPTNFQTIRRKLEKALSVSGSTVSYVTPLDKGEGGAATQFTCRIQDPASWNDLNRAIRELDGQLPLVGEPRVTAIEIAFDARSKGARRDEMAELTSRYYRFLQRPVWSVSDYRIRRIKGEWCHWYKQRLVAEEGGAELIEFLPGWLPRKLTDGKHTVFIGDENDQITQRIYLKTRDGKLGFPQIHGHRVKPG